MDKMREKLSRLNSPQAWGEGDTEKGLERQARRAKKGGSDSSGKVDTRRLEYFSDADNLHYLLKHPVMTSFLEMELNSLKIRYLLDFIFYLAFVIVLFST